MANILFVVCRNCLTINYAKSEGTKYNKNSKNFYLKTKNDKILTTSQRCANSRKHKYSCAKIIYMQSFKYVKYFQNFSVKNTLNLIDELILQSFDGFSLDEKIESDSNN